MNTALLASGSASATATGTPPADPLWRPNLIVRIVRGAAAVLPDWRRRPRPLDRDDAMAMHQLRREAARLREEQFRQATFARLL